MTIDHIDHFVLTVSSIERTCQFYREVLGMAVVTFSSGRTALTFGTQKINLHSTGETITPRSQQPTIGSADVCFVCQTPLEDVIIELGQHQILIEEGPVIRTGARGAIRSVYIRDPD